MPWKKIIPLLAALYCILTCCNKTLPQSAAWQMIAGRDDSFSLERPVLYRALVPSSWKRYDSPAAESIVDTTKAICEFYIQDSIRLTVHTFPIVHPHMRIPPQAQITRWKKQFEELNLMATHTLPETHGGFSGLFFEGEGILQGNPHKVMGWSMQLASIYERLVDSNKRADYTIKASGPPDLMHKHRADLLAFARSFELIEELPTPP